MQNIQKATEEAIPTEKKQLNEQEMSRLYGLSVHWFRRKRVKGGGPVFRKIGNRCFYDRDEAEKYFTAKTMKNTSEYQTRRPVEALEAKKLQCVNSAQAAQEE